MNPSSFWNLSRFIIILVFSLQFSGCASLDPSKPNLPYAGNTCPPVLNELADKNPLLAHELAKLPELQDDISEEEVTTLEQLMKVYNDNPEAFNKAFEQMYQVGKPEVRKYCSPLQAIFWLSQQNADGLKPLIENYKTKVLLAVGWEFYNKERWKDPADVIDRLNAPELVQYWFINNFTYDWSKFMIRAPSAYPQTASTTIKIKNGICFDAAFLAYTCLKRAGYDATGLNVYFGRRTKKSAIMHSVCIIKSNENGRSTYYKLADTSYRGKIQGPYESIELIAKNIADQQGVSLGTFTTGKPEYHYDLFMSR
ncbi:MAG: hypothetical protein KJO26_15375 [Deltaproteobacteria bacterium]|nr:hypothetical protein [Deltaproteobacteria bacterium]